MIFQHAHALELLADHLTEGSKALDVGSGSGYLTACMGILVGLYNIFDGLICESMYREEKRIKF